MSTLFVRPLERKIIFNDSISGCSTILGSILEYFNGYSACTIHDFCYDSYGRKRENCDEEFKKNFIEICGSTSLKCQSLGELAYASVQDFGKHYRIGIHKCKSSCKCR